MSFVPIMRFSPLNNDNHFQINFALLCHTAEMKQQQKNPFVTSYDCHISFPQMYCINVQLLQPKCCKTIKKNGKTFFRTRKFPLFSLLFLLNNFQTAFPRTNVQPRGIHDQVLTVNLSISLQCNGPLFLPNARTIWSINNWQRIGKKSIVNYQWEKQRQQQQQQL